MTLKVATIRHALKANPASGELAGFMVELSGVEPLTS